MTELEEFESWCDDLEAWERYRNEIIHNIPDYLHEQNN